MKLRSLLWTSNDPQLSQSTILKAEGFLEALPSSFFQEMCHFEAYSTFFDVPSDKNLIVINKQNTIISLDSEKGLGL